jgi:hypothetical protein
VLREWDFAMKAFGYEVPDNLEVVWFSVHFQFYWELWKCKSWFNMENTLKINMCLLYNS